MIFILPNFITFLRLPLALAFLQENPTWRTIALLLAMLSDCLDGYIARRYNARSRFGTFFDPFTDKAFVVVLLAVFISEGRLNLSEASAMLCRDLAVMIFGIYLAYKGTLIDYQFRSIFSGKITTAMQFFILLGLTMGFSFPPVIFLSFVLLGAAALGELYLSRQTLKIE